MNAPAKDVDEYLAAVPPEARVALEKLRKTIRAAAPRATEVISYRLPTFKYHGPLVAFGAATKHCAFYVMSTSVIDAHRDELKGYDTGKGTVRFAAGEPPPAALVKKLVKARIEENEAGTDRKDQRDKGYGRR